RAGAGRSEGRAGARAHADPRPRPAGLDPSGAPEEGEIDPDLVVSRFDPSAARARGEEDGEVPDGLRGDPGRTPFPTIPPGEPIVLVETHLNNRFVLTEIGLAVVTEREIFGEEIRHEAPRRRQGAAFISDFRDLRAGDLVVHVDHGVGRYLGLSR